MTKTTKIMLISLVAIAIVATVIIMWPKKQKEESGKENANDKANDKANATGANTVNTPSTSVPKTNSGQKKTVSKATNNNPAPVSDPFNWYGPKTTTQEPNLFNGPIFGLLLDQPAKKPNWTVKEGNRGEEVRKVQDLINLMIKANLVKANPLSTDGVWGSRTSAAVRQVWPSNTVSYDQYISKYNEVVGLLAYGKNTTVPATTPTNTQPFNFFNSFLSQK